MSEKLNPQGRGPQKINAENLNCFACGRTATKHNELLFTECRHIFCFECARTDKAGPVACRLCRRRTSAVEIRAEGLPAELKMLLEDPGPAISVLKKSFEVQIRLKELSTRKTELRLQKMRPRLEAVEKHVASIEMARRKYEKFKKRLKRLKDGQEEPSPRTKAILQSLSEMNSDQKIEDFLQCLKDNFETSEGSLSESETIRRDTRREESSRVDARFPTELRVRQHADVPDTPTLSSYSCKEVRLPKVADCRTVANSIELAQVPQYSQTIGRAYSYARYSESLPRRTAVPANRATCPPPSRREPLMTPNSWQLGGVQSASALPASYR